MDALPRDLRQRPDLNEVTRAEMDTGVRAIGRAHARVRREEVAVVPVCAESELALTAQLGARALGGKAASHHVRMAPRSYGPCGSPCVSR